MFESRRPDRQLRSAEPAGLSATLVVGTRQASSWSLRAWLALDMARRPFDVVEIDLFAPNATERLEDVSPSGKVPVLVTSGTWIWDSLAIMEWAAEMAPELWPSHARRRAVARSALAEMHSGFAALREALPMDWFARYTLAGPLPAPAAADLDRVLDLWRSLLDETGGDAFLFGPTPVLTDLGFVPMASRLVTYGLMPDDPMLRGYAERLVALPALARWFRDAAPHPVLPSPPPVAVGGSAPPPARRPPVGDPGALPADVPPLVPGSARRLEEIVARARAKGIGVPPETAPSTPHLREPDPGPPLRPPAPPPFDGDEAPSGLPWLRRRPSAGDTPGGPLRRRPPRRDE